MKRNIINEITSVRTRSEYNSRYEISSRLSDIEYALSESLNYNGDYDKELLKYIPIAIVACFEAFFRSVIKEMIDFGKPYSDNLLAFNQSKNVKFDFDIINAIQTKTVTLGEFVSHILPCNNYDDINFNLTTLTGHDFSNSLKTFSKESVFDFIKDTSISFIKDSDHIITDVRKTFELRHIFCHEFATNVNINKDDILRCFHSSKIFLNQSNNYIWDLIHPNAPETQTEMNIQASADYEMINAELISLILLIKEATKENSYTTLDPLFFDKTITEWEKYKIVKAEVDASYYKGGSIYSMIYSKSLITTTKEKIESLSNEYNIDLKRLAKK